MLLAGVVAEFESRAEERQSKADAELVEMKQKLEDDWEQRSEEQSNTGAPVEMLVTMKNQIELLLGRLTQSQDEVASLKVQLEQQETQLEEQKTQLEENQAEVVDSGSDDEEEAERKTLAQMQLEIARERAEIARERAEVEELKAQQESKSEPREVSEADSRIMAMRDHLREIHDKEAIEKAKISLSQKRIPAVLPAGSRRCCSRLLAISSRQVTVTNIKPRDSTRGAFFIAVFVRQELGKKLVPKVLVT